MSDNKLIAVLVGGFIAAICFTLMGLAIGLWMTPAHPGLHHLPQFDEITVFGTLTKKCDAWANFTPNTKTAFKLGQHYVSECHIVKTGG